MCYEGGGLCKTKSISTVGRICYDTSCEIMLDHAHVHVDDVVSFTITDLNLIKEEGKQKADDGHNITASVI